MNSKLFASIVILSLLFFTSATQAQQTKPATQTQSPASEQKIDKLATSGVTVADISVACKYYFSKVFNTRENVSRKNICNGYFFGAASMLLLLQSEEVETDTCIPMDVSTEEIIRGFMEWVDKNPNKMKMLAGEALLEVLRLNYSCNEYHPQ